MSNVSTTIQMSCHVSCHVSSHIEAQLSQTSQHISALYAAATMLIKPVARQAWQAQSAQIQGIASNSFEQLGLSWTALSCFQRHSKAFQSPTWSELVWIALLSSAELCWALSCSVKLVGEVSHGNASGDSWVMLRRSLHWRAQPIANRCWTSSPGNWLHRIFFQHIAHIASYCNILSKESRTI